MVDLEKLVQEFVFLREKIKEAAGFVAEHENAKACFLLGELHIICNSHAVTVSQLIPLPAPATDSAVEDKIEQVPGE